MASESRASGPPAREPAAGDGGRTATSSPCRLCRRAQPAARGMASAKARWATGPVRAIATSASHCSAAASETMSRAARRSRVPRSRAQPRVSRAAAMPGTTPRSAGAHASTACATEVSPTAVAETSAPRAAHPMSALGRRSRSATCRPCGAFCRSANSPSVTAAAAVSPKKNGSCTRPPCSSTWSRSTPSKHSSRSAQAMSAARPIQREGFSARALKGRKPGVWGSCCVGCAMGPAFVVSRGRNPGAYGSPWGRGVRGCPA